MSEPRPAPATETIGERLRRLRLERAFSQREIASPGVSYAYISRIEAGDRRPSVKALRLLARKLNVSPTYLETGSDLGPEEDRELRLADAELALRLEDDSVAAMAQLGTVLDEAVQAGDARAAARARVGLGLAAARLGAHREAIQHLESAAESGAISPAVRPDAYATLGRAYAFLGEQRRAIQLWEGCLRTLAEEVPDNVAGRVRFATYLSYALTDLGEFARAKEVLTDALEAAEAVIDPYTQIRVYWSLARLLALQGQPAEALGQARRAVALLEATEDTLDLGRAHLLCAYILNSDGQGLEAENQLALAERLLGPRPERPDLTSLLSERAKAAALLGQGDAAVRYADQALELLGGDDPAERGAALAARADGLLLTERADEAPDSYERAVELLASNGRLREAAEAALRWGRALRAAGRVSEAVPVLEQAAELAAGNWRNA